MKASKYNFNTIVENIKTLECGKIIAIIIAETKNRSTCPLFIGIEAVNILDTKMIAFGGFGVNESTSYLKVRTLPFDNEAEIKFALDQMESLIDYSIKDSMVFNQITKSSCEIKIDLNYKYE